MDNPFPAEAVATFGAALTTCETLGYIMAVESELSAYLRSYVNDPAGAGASVSIAGGHGAGKTHALGWLAQRLAANASIRGESVYVKCDSSQFFDAYTQVLVQIPREKLIELIQLALLQLARKKVRAAKLTESVADRLDTPGALTILDGEKNIDLALLRQELVDELENITGAPKDLPRVLLEVPSAEFGAEAYEWLGGRSQASLALGVSRSLLSTVAERRPDAGNAHSVRRGVQGAPSPANSLATPTRDADLASMSSAPQGRPQPAAVTADSDLASIKALEVIAALYRCAGVPIVFLVDQFEVLAHAPTDPVRFGSLVKKFVEQLRRRGALVFIAGTPRSWEGMPRDVAARFRTREPIVVGRLTGPEVSALLSAYHAPEPIMRCVDDIHARSGGTPREVLQIAYQAFNILKKKEKLKEKENSKEDVSLTDQDIVQAAESSGSIAAQSDSALAIVDETLKPMGQVIANIMIENVRVDRLFTSTEGKPLLAIFLIGASDRLNEVDWYRRLARASNAVPKDLPGAQVLALLVGYSSEAAEEAFGLVEQVRFDENTLGPILKSRAVKALSAPLEEPAKSAAESSAWLATVMERLDALEAERRREQDETAKRFSAASARIASDAAQDRQLKTRVEIFDALDSLRRTIRDEDEERERAILRAILIANESYLHNDALEKLGALYRELINFPHYYSENRKRRIVVIDAMYRELGYRPSQLLNSMTSVYTWLALVFSVTMTIATGIVSSVNAEGRIKDPGWFLFLPKPYDFISTLPFIFLFVAFIVVYILMIGIAFTVTRNSRTAKMIEVLREDFGLRKSELSSIRDSHF